MVTGCRRAASFGFAEVERFFGVDDDETWVVIELDSVEGEVREC